MYRTQISATCKVYNLSFARAVDWNLWRNNEMDERWISWSWGRPEPLRRVPRIFKNDFCWSFWYNHQVHLQSDDVFITSCDHAVIYKSSILLKWDHHNSARMAFLLQLTLNPFYDELCWTRIHWSTPFTAKQPLLKVKYRNVVLLEGRVGRSGYVEKASIRWRITAHL